ncbi:MAG: FAD binding domain-containing protein [Desulfobacteraceae bacterium]|nr:FAD binding domain-containing protein [Desulfobacteraceae bacterium]
MRLPKFEYLQPTRISEAVSMLQSNPAAKLLAGGTDLLVNMKHRVEVPPVVVNIKMISDLDYIRHDNGAVRIGALTPLKRIYQTPFIAEKLPALARATSFVGSFHHQTMGTLAGNLCQQNRCKYYNQSQWWRSTRPTCFKAGGEICHVVNKEETCYSSYCGDSAPALLVMKARVALQGAGGSREILLGELFSGDGKTPLDLRKGEILTEIIIPAEAAQGVSSYTKYANRESIDFPIVGAAFWGSTEKKAYRVAFTAVDKSPVRGHRIEAFLDGEDLSQAIVAEASKLASKEATPVKNSIFSPGHKRKMMGILFQSAVNEATRRPG